MKKLFFALFVFVSVMFPTFEFAYGRDVYVRGYTRKDGTYVQPHHRSAPDSNPYNNWSTKGNVNPYTGQMGTHNPDSSYGTSSHRQGNSNGGNGSLLNNGSQGLGGY